MTKQITIRKRCPEKDCGGELKSTGVVLTRYPCQYDHSCIKCGVHENFWEVYPRVEIENPEKAERWE